jgi:hypothetical protein
MVSLDCFVFCSDRIIAHHHANYGPEKGSWSIRCDSATLDEERDWREGKGLRRLKNRILFSTLKPVESLEGKEKI